MTLHSWLCSDNGHFLSCLLRATCCFLSPKFSLLSTHLTLCLLILYLHFKVALMPAPIIYMFFLYASQRTLHHLNHGTHCTAWFLPSCLPPPACVKRAKFRSDLSVVDSSLGLCLTNNKWAMKNYKTRHGVSLLISKERPTGETELHPSASRGMVLQHWPLHTEDMAPTLPHRPGWTDPTGIHVGELTQPL